jgi:hypothetical protein
MTHIKKDLSGCNVFVHAHGNMLNSEQYALTVPLGISFHFYTEPGRPFYGTLGNVIEQEICNNIALKNMSTGILFSRHAGMRIPNFVLTPDQPGRFIARVSICNRDGWWDDKVVTIGEIHTEALLSQVMDATLQNPIIQGCISDGYIIQVHCLFCLSDIPATYVFSNPTLQNMVVKDRAAYTSSNSQARQAKDWIKRDRENIDMDIDYVDQAGLKTAWTANQESYRRKRITGRGTRKKSRTRRRRKSPRKKSRKHRRRKSPRKKSRKRRNREA